MGKLNVAGITYDNPKQIAQDSLVFPPGCVNNPDRDVVAGNVWKPNFAMSFPKPDSFDATQPTALPVLFGKQPSSLSSGGIAVPNSSTTVKNPA